MGNLVWLPSYPKSGNTWVRFMLADYLTGKPVSSADDLASVAPDYHTVLNSGEMIDAASKDTLVVKTHFLPTAGLVRMHGEHSSKVVHIVRNPRDVLLSGMRFVNADGAEQAGRFARSFLDRHGLPWVPEVAYGTWPRSVAAWSDEAGMRELLPHADVCTVRYEDLRADPVTGLRSILEFLDLGQPVRAADVETAVERSSLEAMRELERTEPSIFLFGNAFGGGDLPPFVGQGRSGQSLADVGADVEANYQRLVTGDGDFGRCARRFGYAD